MAFDTSIANSSGWNYVSAGQVQASGYANLSAWRDAAARGQASLPPQVVQNLAPVSAVPAGQYVPAETKYVAPPAPKQTTTSTQPVYDASTGTYYGPGGPQSTQYIPPGATVINATPEQTAYIEKQKQAAIVASKAPVVYGQGVNVYGQTVSGAFQNQSMVEVPKKSVIDIGKEALGIKPSGFEPYVVPSGTKLFNKPVYIASIEIPVTKVESQAAQIIKGAKISIGTQILEQKATFKSDRTIHKRIRNITGKPKSVKQLIELSKPKIDTTSTFFEAPSEEQNSYGKIIDELNKRGGQYSQTDVEAISKGKFPSLYKLEVGLGQSKQQIVSSKNNEILKGIVGLGSGAMGGALFLAQDVLPITPSGKLRIPLSSTIGGMTMLIIKPKEVISSMQEEFALSPGFFIGEQIGQTAAISKGFGILGKGVGKIGDITTQITKTEIPEVKYVSKKQLAKLKEGTPNAYPQKTTVQQVKEFLSQKYGYAKASAKGVWHEATSKVKGEIGEGSYGVGLHGATEQSRAFLRAYESVSTETPKIKFSLNPFATNKPVSYWVEAGELEAMPKVWEAKLKSEFKVVMKENPTMGFNEAAAKATIQSGLTKWLKENPALRETPARVLGKTEGEFSTFGKVEQINVGEGAFNKFVSKWQDYQIMNEKVVPIKAIKVLKEPAPELNWFQRNVGKSSMDYYYYGEGVKYVSPMDFVPVVSLSKVSAPKVSLSRSVSAASVSVPSTKSSILNPKTVYSIGSVVSPQIVSSVGVSQVSSKSIASPVSSSISSSMSSSIGSSISSPSESISSPSYSMGSLEPVSSKSVVSSPKSVLFSIRSPSISIKSSSISGKSSIISPAPSNLRSPGKSITSYLITVPKLPPPTYKTRTYPSNVLISKKKYKLNKAFDVFTRKKGKVVKLGGGLPFGRATSLGVGITEHTAARSFVVIPKGYTRMSDVAIPSLFQYRQPKFGGKIHRLGFKFVEKSKFAINTPGEKREIKNPKRTGFDKNFLKVTKPFKYTLGA
jgi:hypothetical protein